MAASLLLAYCRSGFEGECAQEIAAKAQRDGVSGHVRAKPESAYVTFHPHDPLAAAEWLARQSPDEHVFPRQLLGVSGVLSGLDPGNRIAPIVDAVLALGEAGFAELVLESPDTNEGRALASLLKPLRSHLVRALGKSGIALGDGAGPHRLHVFFVGSSACHVGIGRSGLASAWPMGIPRIRVRGRSPSRSGHKLAEAFEALAGGAPRPEPGALAVDLGASPGGWTSQLLAAGFSVIAVDNGPMAPALLETGRVKHLREDGFRYRPPHPVPWMVCDIVESPSRVAALAAQWVAEGWCRQAIFNLKLPMKRRREEVETARTLVADALGRRPFRLRLKQLYHDREEVTAWLSAR